ncbi:hypothetical protein TNCT_636741 [Trichonephila clavata]|uniref:Uncharacterized protein n=1 Tax=Trichonephila clavata TaxID=2740835 RepID=A0A8X6LT25_TRICU|nr:hypothetical protein TNCT_636741 [Trichonephila clavata]
MLSPFFHSREAPSSVAGQIRNTPPPLAVKDLVSPQSMRLRDITFMMDRGNICSQLSLPQIRPPPQQATRYGRQAGTRHKLRYCSKPVE